jgi:hypothetical protein
MDAAALERLQGEMEAELLRLYQLAQSCLRPFARPTD